MTTISYKDKTIFLSEINLISHSVEGDKSIDTINLRSPINSLDTKNAVGEFRGFKNLAVMQEQMKEFVANSYKV